MFFLGYSQWGLSSESQLRVVAPVVAANDDRTLDGLLVVAFVHGTNAEEEIVEVDGGDNHAEDAHAHADAFCLEVVTQQGGGIEGVMVVLQFVVLVEVVENFFVRLVTGVCEDVAYVVDGIVNPVGLDAVVGLDALADVVVHLGHHVLLVRYAEVSDEKQHAHEGGKDDELTQAAVVKRLKERLLGSEMSFVGLLFHRFTGFCCDVKLVIVNEISGS